MELVRGAGDAGDAGTPTADEAFDAFVRAHQKSLHRTAYLMTGDRERAQDVVQTALAKLYQAWPRRAEWDHPLAYARQAVVSTVLRSAERRWWGEKPTEHLPEHDTADPAPDALAADRDQLRRALADLPVRQRSAVVLRYYLDLSEAATADAMACPPGTVKSLTARGLAALRTSLAEASA